MEITEVIHEEFCLFPMNLPLPDRSQPVLAFGVRRAWCIRFGYMVGSLLRRGPDLAQAISAALANPSLGSAARRNGVAGAVAD